MAKEENKEQEANLANIEEVINNGAVVTEDIAKEAAEKIAKRRKEELTDRLIQETTKAEYVRKHILLSMKKTEKDAAYKKEYLKKYSELHEKLKSGGISVDDFQKQVAEEKKTCGKKIRENDDKFRENLEKLNEQYPCSWSYRYDANI